MYNVQIQKIGSDGQKIPINPISKDKNISLSSTNSNLPQGSSTVGDVMANLGTLAFANDINIPMANTETAGVVTLSSEISDPSDESKAATVKAVSVVNDSAVHKTGNEDITGTKNFVDGVLINGNLKITTRTDAETGDVTVDFAQI